MKILYNHRTQARGAEGTHITNIVCGLRELGHEVDVLSPPGIDPFSESNSVPVDKSDVETSGLATVWKTLSKYAPNIVFELLEITYNISLWFRMRRMLLTERYDAIYERYAFYMLSSAVLAEKHKIPFFLEINELSGVRTRSRPQRLSRVCLYFERKLLPRCATVFVVSSTLEGMVRKRGVQASEVCVVPNAIDKAKIVIDDEKRESLKRRFELNGKITIGCVGWFDEWDRLDFLLSVFHEITKERDDARLLLIGDGPSVSDIRKLVAEAGLVQKVIFTGAIEKSEISTYQSLLDIAILPHSNDYGSPVVLFELLGLGIPVVAPKLPPILDVVAHGDTALLFEPLSIIDCKKQIERLVLNDSLRSKLSTRGKTLVNEQFTWIKNATMIENAIKAAQHN